MKLSFEHVRDPHIEKRKETGAPKRGDEPKGINDKIAVILTAAVGTMWCAYAFAILALIALPATLQKHDAQLLVQWISQTFIQLVMLSVIMVGQGILGRASDKRSEMTYKDAEATFHEAEQIQQHLKAQDEAINAILDRLEKLEEKMTKA